MKIKIELPVIDPDEMRLHSEMATADVDGRKVAISSGFGCGHASIYVSVNGVRRLAVDGSPLLQVLVARALMADDDAADS